MKKASIDSFTVNDTNDLFKWICDNYLEMGYIEAKIKILGYKRSYAMAYKVKLEDIVRIIVKYKIPIKFEVLLPEKEPVEFVDEDDDNEIAPPVFIEDSEITKSLKAQVSEITNPDLSDLKINDEVELEKIEPYKSKIDSSKIPDFF